MTRLELALLVAVVAAANIFSGCARHADASSAAPRPGAVSRDAGTDQGPMAPAPPDLASAVHTAVSWLSALRQRDRTTLLKQSSAPFVIRDESGKGPCSNVELTDLAKPDSLGCLADDEILRGVLKENPDPDVGPLSAKHLPNWTRKWKADVRPGVRPLGVVLLGHAASFDLVILVGGDGVHGVFKHAAADRN